MEARRLADHWTWTHIDLEQGSARRIGKQFIGLIPYVAKATDRTNKKLYIKGNDVQNDKSKGDKK